MLNILFTYAMVNWLKPFPHEMSHPTFINLFTRIMVKWLNGRVYTRNAQHGRTHYHGGGRGGGRANYRPGLNLKIPPCVTKPPLRYSRLQPSINTRRINSILIDATFCSIRYSWIHRSFKYTVCRTLCMPSLSFSLSIYLSLSLFLSRHNYTLPRVNGERSCLRFEWYAAPDFDVEGGRGEIWKLSDISKWNICKCMCIYIYI